MALLAAAPELAVAQNAQSDGSAAARLGAIEQPKKCVVYSRRLTLALKRPDRHH